ncbi:hypothetical protein AAF712_010657 [Marasmius tenuissimus]|uniref:Uncharacterized protein n=1 Tax=Marasmius tenuissimus TaxID=585030 RepID=A0ABR2ZL91_9AGAR
MSDNPSDLTPKMRTMSLTQVNQAGEPTEEEEMEDLDGTLLLDFMLENEPFEVLLAQYYPKKELDHRPPIFEYGVALTEAQLVEYARKHGLATDQLDSPHPKWSKIFRAVGSTLDNQLELKPQGGILRWSSPYTKNKELVLLLALCTNYNTKIRVANPRRLVQRLEKEFGEPAKWYMSCITDGGLRPHYKVSGEVSTVNSNYSHWLTSDMFTYAYSQWQS